MAAKKKNLIVILGSPRSKGLSAQIAEKIAEGAEKKGANVESVFLQELNIKPCCACEGCHKPASKGCVIRDDMQDLYKKISKADAFVLATPVYWFTMSAQLKTFIDRCYATLDNETYKTVFSGKNIALAISYGAEDVFESGAGNIVNSIKESLSFQSASLTGVIHASSTLVTSLKNDKKLSAAAILLGQKLVS